MFTPSVVSSLFLIQLSRQPILWFLYQPISSDSQLSVFPGQWRAGVQYSTAILRLRDSHVVFKTWLGACAENDLWLLPQATVNPLATGACGTSLRLMYHCISAMNSDWQPSNASENAESVISCWRSQRGRGVSQRAGWVYHLSTSSWPPTLLPALKSLRSRLYSMACCTPLTMMACTSSYPLTVQRLSAVLSQYQKKYLPLSTEDGVWGCCSCV